MSWMTRGRKNIRAGALAAAAAAAVVLAASSCGGADTSEESGDAVKLPPGVSESEAAGRVPDGDSSAPLAIPGEGEPSEESGVTDAASAPQASVVLGGGRFTVLKATRPDSNRSVISSGDREVKGDYLEIGLAVENAATGHMVDLSEYSFRLESPGIAAGTYYNYYGNVGTYGKYVSENVISATLLDYANLNPVSYLLKVGESVDQVFLFFDLNPENVGRNPGVTRENTFLVIRKVSGSEYGAEMSVPLAGYPD